MGNLLNRYGPAAYENLYGFEENAQELWEGSKGVTEPERRPKI